MDSDADRSDDEFSSGGECEDFDDEEEETKTRFTNYSLSSSVIRRTEGLTLLDDRFEKVKQTTCKYYPTVCSKDGDVYKRFFFYVGGGGGRGEVLFLEKWLIIHLFGSLFELFKVIIGGVFAVVGENGSNGNVSVVKGVLNDSGGTGYAIDLIIPSMKTTSPTMTTSNFISSCITEFAVRLTLER